MGQSNKYYAINGNSVIDLYHTDIKGNAADLYVGEGGTDIYKKSVTMPKKLKCTIALIMG